MATGGVLGNGVKIGFSTTAASPYTYTTCKNVRVALPPGLESDEVETTVHSTNRTKRHMPGLIDVPEIELTFLEDLDPATSADQDSLYTHCLNGDTMHWRVEIPVNRAQTSYLPIEFNGWVKKWRPDTPLDKDQELKVSVRFDDTTLTKLTPGASTLGQAF